MSSTVIFERHSVKAKAPRFAPRDYGKLHRPFVRASDSGKTVHCFVDYSNLFVNAIRVAEFRAESFRLRQRLKINFSNLQAFVQRNRDWGSGYAAAGLDNGDEICEQSKKAGIDFGVFERGRISNREQGIDEIIQKRMYQLLAKPVGRGVVVLVSGDGNGDGRDMGFLPALKALHQHGYEVEVVSWKISLNGTMRTWTVKNGRLIELDQWFDYLTEQPGRPVKSRRELDNRMASSNSDC